MRLIKYRHNLAEVEKIHIKVIVITTLKLSSSQSRVTPCWTSNILKFSFLHSTTFLSVPGSWIKFRPKLSSQNENYTKRDRPPWGPCSESALRRWDCPCVSIHNGALGYSTEASIEKRRITSETRDGCQMSRSWKGIKYSRWRLQLIRDKNMPQK